MTATDFNIKLPESDIVEAGYLESMLNNNSSSYKFFWFKGIFEEVMSGNTTIAYKRVVARMIAAAWYPVMYYKLSLGVSDKLSEAILYLHEVMHIPQDEKVEKIIAFICDSNDRQILKYVKHFTQLVPYRLIRPFYQREIEYAKKTDLSYYDGKANSIIIQCNRNDAGHAFYRMDDENDVLTVSPSWVHYLRINASVIEGWMNYKLVAYLQKQNPNVPAIPFKVFPPTAKDRNLTKEMKYWKRIQKKMLLRDIYTGLELNDVNAKEYGEMSIDHFIPWRFVLHNEIWNLYPTFKNVNSEKNSRLPDKDRYLYMFCENQYQAFLTAREIGGSPQIMEQYLKVNKDIFQIEKSDRGHDAFIAAMEQTIEPLYQIANNQGYGIWWYREKNGKE